MEFIGCNIKQIVCQCFIKKTKYKTNTMIKSITPRVSGFNIELLSPTFILNVQDINGNLVSGASVNVQCGDDNFTGKTDAVGSCAVIAEPGEICTLTVTNDCYRPFVQRFIAVPIDTTKNYVIKVVDSSDNPVTDASVHITSSQPDSINGFTDVIGMYEVMLNTNFTNTISIQKSGMQTITYTYNAFSPITSYNENFRIIPVITMTT